MSGQVVYLAEFYPNGNAPRTPSVTRLIGIFTDVGLAEEALVAEWADAPDRKVSAYYLRWIDKPKGRYLIGSTDVLRYGRIRSINLNERVDNIQSAC